MSQIQRFNDKYSFIKTNSVFHVIINECGEDWKSIDENADEQCYKWVFEIYEFRNINDKIMESIINTDFYDIHCMWRQYVSDSQLAFNIKLTANVYRERNIDDDISYLFGDSSSNKFEEFETTSDIAIKFEDSHNFSLNKSEVINSLNMLNSLRQFKLRRRYKYVDIINELLSNNILDALIKSIEIYSECDSESITT